ncbi:hypothetical protein D3C75_815980 [compost metagenome]
MDSEVQRKSIPGRVQTRTPGGEHLAATCRKGIYSAGQFRPYRHLVRQNQHLVGGEIAGHIHDVEQVVAFSQHAHDTGIGQIALPLEFVTAGTGFTRRFQGQDRDVGNRFYPAAPRLLRLYLGVGSANQGIGCFVHQA